MISVIIPLYNKSQYIKRAIDSILNQSFQDFEIIIVDDGSTDDSVAIVTDISHQDDRISIFSKKNAGVSSTRNYGISVSKYPYLAFLDGDDYYHFRFLETIYLLIAKFNEVEIFSSAVSHDKLNNNINNFSFIEINKTDYFKLLLRHHPLLTSSSTVLKKDLLSQNNLEFDENIKFGEDTDFWNRCIKSTKANGMIYIPTKLACYDINDSNTSIKNKNLKPILSTDFYKILNTKEIYFLKGEKIFLTFYVYRYFIIYYQSIMEAGLLKDVTTKIALLEYNNSFIQFLLKYMMKDWSKKLLLKFITYYRLSFSKSLKSLPFQKINY